MCPGFYYLLAPSPLMHDIRAMRTHARNYFGRTCACPRSETWRSRPGNDEPPQSNFTTERFERAAVASHTYAHATRRATFVGWEIIGAISARAFVRCDNDDDRKSLAIRNRHRSCAYTDRKKWPIWLKLQWFSPPIILFVFNFRSDAKVEIVICVRGYCY